MASDSSCIDPGLNESETKGMKINVTKIKYIYILQILKTINGYLYDGDTE